MRCTACKTDDHDRAAHVSPLLAYQEAEKAEARGKRSEARVWRQVARTLARKGAA